ncbi:spore germination protein [Cohnella sp. AR92]|uniref:spore germination protein n=1 Tax=Cohnella sp. AR92 TaxID=648716 RepID=UPI000F8F4063|nr:spore germination protein [Cohnella sp. AR92]RUS48119.1 spore germination protein [Cohnella sp. AR92]
METNEHGSMDLSSSERNPGSGEMREIEEEGRTSPGMIVPRPIGANRRREGKERSDRESRSLAERNRSDGGEASETASQEEPGGFNVGNPEDLKPEDRIPPRIEDWLEALKKESGLEASFDVQVRQMTFGDKRTGFFFLSCMIKDTAMTEILKRLSQLDPESLRLGQSALKSFFEFYLPAIQVTVTSSMTKMIEDVMVGNAALYVDGEPTVLIIDAKQYPSRTPDEPVLEKVVRGSKDGFTETLLMNVALVRRRLRDPHLRFEIAKVGTRTQTEVAIGYVEDVADNKLVEAVRDKIQAVNIDGIPLADKQLEEMTVKTDWNPFPLVRYSERPDVVSSHLMNGSVAVIVDTSPSVMLLPTTFFDLIQHAEEDRQNPFIGTYLRWVRFFGVLSSIFLLPLWFLYAENAWLRPHWLWFLGADKTGDLPLILQFIMVEIGVDLMRLASVHTPSPLVTAMSLVSAILIGDIAVKTGLFINEVILYMAVAAIGMFATPSYELGLANRIVRLALLLSAFVFKAPGFIAATAIITIWLAMTRSFNSPYLWPFIPFNAGGMLQVLLRRPLPKNKVRPSLNRTKMNRKQPAGS